jgi:hypothetical protein
MAVTPDSISVIEIPTTTNVFDVLTTQTVTLQVGPQGPQGPQGFIGLPSATFYTFVQGVASAVWTITHNLNGYPTAEVIDSAGTNVIGDFSWPNVNTLVITLLALPT